MYLFAAHLNVSLLCDIKCGILFRNAIKTGVDSDVKAEVTTLSDLQKLRVLNFLITGVSMLKINKFLSYQYMYCPFLFSHK